MRVTMGSVKTNLVEVLKQNFYFKTLSGVQLEALATIAHSRHYEPGECIFTEGQKAVSLYQVISGQVQIYKISREGKEMILHLLGAGEVFAEFPFFANLDSYPANAICLQPTEVLAIDGQAFRALAKTSPEIMFCVLERFADKLREFNQLIEDLSLRNVDSRLAKYLLTLSENTPDKAFIQVHKKTLASILGTIPETLSRTLKKLTSDNIIQVQDKEVRILDREALKSLADME